MAALIRKPTKRLVIAGGGTGGHFFPAVAIAQEWLERDPEADVLFIGSERGIEAKQAPELGFKLKKLRVLPLKRINLFAKIKSLFLLPLAIWDAYKSIREYNPDFVLSVGGYSAGPAGVAAWLVGRPLVILEQNSVPGFTNKILGKMASVIFIAFSNAEKYFPKNSTALTGNPVNKKLLAMHTSRPSPREKHLLLITGGSQGAMGLNQLVLDAFATIKRDIEDIEIIHQCGSIDYETTVARYKSLGIKARVEPFIKDISLLFAEASLVIGRSGAGTVSELLVLGTPAIYIPFPFAADDHQRTNTTDSVAGGAALSFDQFTTNGAMLGASIKKILFNDKLRGKMSAAAKILAKPHAATDIVKKLQEEAK